MKRRFRKARGTRVFGLGRRPDDEPADDEEEVHAASPELEPRQDRPAVMRELRLEVNHDHGQGREAPQDLDVVDHRIRPPSLTIENSASRTAILPHLTPVVPLLDRRTSIALPSRSSAPLGPAVLHFQTTSLAVRHIPLQQSSRGRTRITVRTAPDRDEVLARPASSWWSASTRPALGPWPTGVGTTLEPSLLTPEVLNEFGALRTAPRADRVRWLAAVRRGERHRLGVLGLRRRLRPGGGRTPRPRRPRSLAPVTARRFR